MQTTELVYPDRDLPDALLAHAVAMREFADARLRPHAREVDEQVVFRRQTVSDLAAAGILGGPIAAAYGGSDWDAMQVVLANEEIGAACGNARGFLAVHTGLVSQCIQRFGTEDQRSAFLPDLVRGARIGCFGLTEEDAGSDVQSLACRATADGDGFRLHGKKIWITNGGIADLGLVFATVDPDLGREGITGFLVDLQQDGLTRPPMPGMDLGHRGSDHAQLCFDGAFVPGDRILGGVGEGFKVAMGGLTAGRLSVAAGALGIHRAALQASIDFAKARRQFGKPISKFQMVQERIADMAVALVAARELVYRCARHRDAGTETPADLAVAKLFATEAASTAADTAIMLHGGRGYSTEYPVERLLRDSIGLRIYEGTSMIQKLITARAVLA